MQLLHGLCHLVYDEAGTLRPGMTGHVVRATSELPDAEITLHVFPTDAHAAAFVAGVASSGANTASAVQGTEGRTARMALLRRDDRAPRSGESLSDIVTVVDHGGSAGLRIRNAWDWLKGVTPYPPGRRLYGVPYISHAEVPDDGKEPTLSVNGFSHFNHVHLRDGRTSDLVEARLPQWGMAPAFDGTWGIVDDLSKPTGNGKLDELLARYRVRLEDGGKTFVAALPKERFAETLLGIKPLFDELWKLRCSREREHVARKTRADSKHMAVVRKMKSGWSLEYTPGGHKLVPPDGDILKRKDVSGPMVYRLVEAGLIREPFDRSDDNAPMFGWEYVLVDQCPDETPEDGAPQP